MMRRIADIEGRIRARTEQEVRIPWPYSRRRFEKVRHRSSLGRDAVLLENDARIAPMAHDRCTPDSCRLVATPKSAESGQLRAHAPQQSASSFDHLVDADEQRRGNVEVARVDGLEIDCELVPGRP